MIKSLSNKNPVLSNKDMNQMNNNSKKRKNDEVAPSPSNSFFFPIFFSESFPLDEEILPDMKKVKQTNDNISKSNKENEQGIMYRKNDYSSLVMTIQFLAFSHNF